MQLDDRLVMQQELPFGQRPRQLGLDFLALAGRALHRRLVDRIAALALRLG